MGDVSLFFKLFLLEQARLKAFEKRGRDRASERQGVRVRNGPRGQGSESE